MSTCAAAAVDAMKAFIANGTNTFRSIFALKKYTSHPRWLPEELGFLVAGCGTTVFLGNIWALPESTTLLDLDALPQKKYADVDAILSDGWEVD
jgi:hypothetical protein